jgi:hypothetical protein
VANTVRNKSDLGTLLLAVVIAAPAFLATKVNGQEGSVQVRAYDRNHKEYHNWDNREDRAYREYRAYNKQNRRKAEVLLELAPQAVRLESCVDLLRPPRLPGVGLTLSARPF